MTKTLLLTACCLLALVVSKSYVSTQPDNTSQLLIAVLREDGALMPFAQYGNGGWFNPWPKPRDAASSIYAETTEAIPNSLGDLREPWFKQCGKIPATWYLWSSAATPTVLRVSKVLQVENHSQTNWALLTDFPKQNSNDAGHAIIGVALNASEKIEPMIEIKTDSIEAAEIVPFVKQVFDETETSELNRIREEHVAPLQLSTPIFTLPTEERKKTAMSVTKLYRTNWKLDGEHLYYFEAEKQYPIPVATSGQDCNDISIFQGWISASDKGGLGLIDSRLFVTNCDRKGPGTTTPLGSMTLNSDTFLFISQHGWEDESYIILKLDNSGLHRVLETFGG